MIAGMEAGLLDVCIGEWRTIVIPPHLGYGEEGVSKYNLEMGSCKIP